MFKCKVIPCENHAHQGVFVGDFCKPCYLYATSGFTTGKVTEQVAKWIIHNIQEFEEKG